MALIFGVSDSGKLVKRAIISYGASSYLDRLRAHHLDSYRHSMRVGVLSVSMGRAQGMTGDELEMLGLCATLHDAGKIMVPYDLLANSNGALTPDQFEVLKRHPKWGLEVLKGFADGLPGKVAVGHHEFKKEPYPRRKRRNADPREEKYVAIVAAADIGDALAYPRSYKPAMPRAECERILREQFTGDPALVDLTLSFLKD